MTTESTPTPYVFPPMSSQQKATVYIHLKNLIAADRMDKALSYAHKHHVGTDMEAIQNFFVAVEEERRIRKEDNERAAAARDLSNLRRSQEFAETEVLEVAHEPIPEFGDWPSPAEVTIVGECLNPRLLKVRLADGRTATMWKGWTRNAKEGLKFMAKIETFRGHGATAEVIFERI
jgi:hypothetical protein